MHKLNYKYIYQLSKGRGITEKWLFADYDLSDANRAKKLWITWIIPGLLPYCSCPASKHRTREISQMSEVSAGFCRDIRWAFGQIVYGSEHFWHLLLIGHQKKQSLNEFCSVSASLGEGRQLPWLSQLAHHVVLISFKSNDYNCFLSRCSSDLGTTTATWKNPRFMKG